MKHLTILLLHLLVVWSSASTKINPSLLEMKANLRSQGRHAAVVQGELQLRNLESVADLSKLLESGRQKLAATRLVLEQTPAATPAATPATPAAAAATTTSSTTTGADSVADLIQPPQLQPLALPSYGPTMQIDELADIQREQLALRQKKLMVAQQERVIQGSEDDATKLQQLIDVNKQIAKRNEEALVLAQQHLTDRIRAYGERLATEASGTGGSGSASGAAGASGSSLIEADSTDVQTVQTPNNNQADVISQFQSQLKSQADNIQRLQEMLFKRRRRHRRYKNTLPDGNDSDSEDGEPDSSDNSDNTPPATS